MGVRTAGRDRICVVPLHPSGVAARCGNYSGVPRGISGRTEERWPRDITRELRGNAMCHHFLTIDEVSKEGGGEECGGGKGKGNWHVCTCMYSTYSRNIRGVVSR